MSLGAGDVCVAHLVRRSNPLAAFSDFLESYKRCPAGTPHELLVIFKGFSGRGDMLEHERLLDGLPHKKMCVNDNGFDIGPYIDAARAFSYPYFAFFNSFSRLLHAGWLENMLRHGHQPEVGIVGATGSHQSPLTDLADQKQRHRQLRLVFYKYWYVSLVRRKLYLLHVLGRFKPFPNYHVRSNAFLVRREMLMSFHSSAIRTKWDAWRFESGARGLTSRILDAGLKALVVGRDGNAYPPSEWRAARTFWIEEQQNLLVSDNQTRSYAEGDVATRERYAFHAWRCWPDGTPRAEPPRV